jgi:UDP-N-acetylglucosamine--N-acetylmuramyl-(pentapeptide) pyrophosphoryl-undecaprenol N-acetylglucosamine transferase
VNAVSHHLPAPAIASRMSGRRVVIAAGGTGGHFFPAEALAAALLARGVPVALMTDARSGGQDSAVFEGSPVHVLHGAGMAGRGMLRAATAGLALGAGSVQAWGLLRRLHPSAIVGFGGYPTVAPVLGSLALRRRVPVVLHEQNAVLGRTNTMLARRAAALALSFAQTAGVRARAKTVLTGNPVRPAIAALAGQSYRPPGEGPIRLLILGGSLGATVLSDVVPAGLAALPDALRMRLLVTQQCRAGDLENVRAAYATAGITAELATFFTDVAGLLERAHLVIARAGASTVAELTVIGRPAILVPLPAAIDDHQAANAQSCGAWMIRQAEFTPAVLATRIEALLRDPAALATAAAAMAALGRADAAEALADLVERVIAGADA